MTTRFVIEKRSCELTWNRGLPPIDPENPPCHDDFPERLGVYAEESAARRAFTCCESDLRRVRGFAHDLLRVEWCELTAVSIPDDADDPSDPDEGVEWETLDSTGIPHELDTGSTRYVWSWGRWEIVEEEE